MNPEEQVPDSWNCSKERNSVRPGPGGGRQCEVRGVCGLEVLRPTARILRRASRGCRQQLKADQEAARWFLLTVATLRPGLGGCVVFVSSCEEGAGSSAAVGQAPTVHGVAWSWVEHCGRRARGRYLEDHEEQLVPRLPTARARSSGSSLHLTGSRIGRSARGSCRKRGSDRDCGSASCRCERPKDRGSSGRAPSTISRELRGNSGGGGSYRPFDAHR
jgi:hypothetical protein